MTTTGENMFHKTTMNDTNDARDYPVRNGIETCEDLCKCGEHLRLHTHIFKSKNAKPEANYYVDCPKCMITSAWCKTPDEAVNEFDSIYDILMEPEDIESSTVSD